MFRARDRQKGHKESQSLFLQLPYKAFRLLVGNHVVPCSVLNQQGTHIPAGVIGGIRLIPRYAKNMLPADTFVVGISDRSCRFNEYLYYHSRQDNGAAKLFYEEFRNLFIRE